MSSLQAKIWLHGLTRDMLVSGELEALAKEEKISGVVANLALMERAFGEGQAYDEGLGEITDPNSEAVMNRLLIEDAQQAADLLAPIYAKPKAMWPSHW
jgi:transaldolase